MPTFKDISLFSTMTVQEIKSMNTAGNGPFVQVDAEHKVNLKDVVTAFAPAAPNPLSQALTGLSATGIGLPSITSSDNILSAFNDLAAIANGTVYIRHVEKTGKKLIGILFPYNNNLGALIIGINGLFGSRIIFKRDLGIPKDTLHTSIDSTLISILDQGYNQDSVGGNTLMWNGIRTIGSSSTIQVRSGECVHVTGGASNVTISISSNFGIGDTAIVVVGGTTTVNWSGSMKKSEGIADLDKAKLRVYTIQKFTSQLTVVNGCAYE